MTSVYEKALPVGKVGNYTLTIDSGWLGQESITSVNVTSNDVTVALPTFNGNVLQAFFEGVSLGRKEIHWEWSTPTRSDCASTYVDVINC